MLLLAYLHGEGILFSFLIQVFFGVVGAAVLLYGFVRFKSWLGVAIAVGYVALTMVVAFILERVANHGLEIAGWALTLPWNAVVPCYNLQRSCSLTLPVSFICAELNAAILYFLVVWLCRPR